MAIMFMYVGCGCSFLLIYVFSLCLRAPRKIDSSIGLPSLNKVVTYLHVLSIMTFGFNDYEKKHLFKISPSIKVVPDICGKIT